MNSSPANRYSQYFSQSYKEARAKFLAGAEAAGLDATSHQHPMVGSDGELLAMDVVREGPADSESLLIITSACHGVEGFCGSGVQTALLSDPVWRKTAADAGVAVLYVHALNPYGFSWWRRTTHENVDLNRNFHDFHGPLPHNAGYDELAGAIVPASWPPPDAANAALENYMRKHGQAKLQEAISGGQYDYPEGIFYGGRNPTWSHITWRHVLQEQATRCARLGWIDLHTGLGPTGVGERIFACSDDPVALKRARAWWGDKITSIYDGSSTSSPLQGLMWLAAYEECAQAEYTGIALEYGTLPITDMIGALRADQWLENHPDAPDAMRTQIKRQMRDAFYVDTDEWKQQIVEQAVDAVHGAVRGLSGR
jgi:hypothetical protein